tara:strand:+ start:921 stop:2072 length:1152 start_codon:yes stop_codon:yes gene_type:complete
MKRRNFLNFIAASSLFSNFAYVNAKNFENKILILIELQGANDGLNTVIPYNHKRYKMLRPTLSLDTKQVLTIDLDQGLHPSLNFLAKLYETGQLKIVQNLGYPQPILSHFRSIELWETGGDGISKGRQGWLNSSLNEYSEKKDLDGKAIFLDNSGEIFNGGIEGFLGPHIINYVPEEVEGRDTTIPSMQKLPNIGLLDKVRNKRRLDLIRMNRINNKLNNIKKLRFPGGSLGKQLSKACELIEADINIPVFKVSLGSFDTHVNQFGKHRNLLRDLDEALQATVNRLKLNGLWNNTLIMTYSEFGRRAKENGSRGTDHGMAAPHFVMGGKIKGGINGGLPNLDKLKNNDLLYTLDYRSLYDFVLKKHFDFETNPFSEFRSNQII